MVLRRALPIAVILELVGCDATGVEQGGQALVADPCAETDGGHTWSDLYTCYFGPAGRASCSGQSQCHGSAMQPGALTPPGFFVCGSSREECWYGMTHNPMCPDAAPSPTCSPIVVPGADPTQTTLWGRLRGTDGTGAHNMPRANTSAGGYRFTTDDLARISAWIQGGAQDN